MVGILMEIREMGCLLCTIRSTDRVSHDLTFSEDITEFQI